MPTSNDLTWSYSQWLIQHASLSRPRWARLACGVEFWNSHFDIVLVKLLHLRARQKIRVDDIELSSLSTKLDDEAIFC